MPALRRPELLAPAGDWECARAAVENGADAIYFGLERFNARMRAKNFTVADLPDLMSFLHRRGVRGYVTFNTLIFQSELSDAEDYLRSIISAGVDAAIVQDIGICRLIRKLSPDFPIHGSTQMTVSSARGVSFVRELGCNLVVLARECSIAEIEKIQSEQGAVNQYSVNSNQSQTTSQSTDVSETKLLKTDPLNTEPLPLEVFVHGALCVAYSGQCLTSEVLGGRSANRGECAQACRMPYELISDGVKVDLGDRQYLLSPQDLAGVEVLPDLVRAGVSSLKIEGRLKTPEYVASITRIYRQSIDSVFKELEQGQTADARRLFNESRHDLEMSFSRGLYTGWFRGNNNQELAHARFGKKRGVYLGDVTSVDRDRVRVNLGERVKPGDGIVFDHGKPEAGEEGGRVYGIDPARSQNSAEAVLSFGHGAIDFSRVHIGDKVWKTSDPDFDKRVRSTFGGDQPKFQRSVTMEVHGRAGEPMTLLLRDEQGHVVEVSSTVTLEVAQKTPLSTERLTQQLGRLGGTPFQLESLTNRLEGEVILPVSELNRLRRDAVIRLEALRAEPKRWTLASPKTISSEVFSNTDSSGQTSAESSLVVLTRSLEQLAAALDAGITTVYCDFENPKGYLEAVAMVRSFTLSGQNTIQPEVFVAPPRIFKMGEEWIIEQVRSCNPDGFLVRNYDHLDFFADQRMIGDFSLNIANSLTAEYFKNKFSLERITASYDLNAAQLEGLLSAAPAEWFEVTLHQHMPMFHMEHCVFCAFLSKGKDYRDCGRPCDKHSVTLRDRVGMEHPLKADVGCRNTLFNARAQTGAEFYTQLYDLGVRRFRIEFVNETAADVKTTLAKYQSLLNGEISGNQLWRELKLHNQLGVTRGQMGR
jgi:putative protease